MRFLKYGTMVLALMGLCQVAASGEKEEKSIKLLSSLKKAVHLKNADRFKPSKGQYEGTSEHNPNAKEHLKLLKFDEQDYLVIEQQVINKWERSWRAGNPDDFFKLLSDDAKIFDISKVIGKLRHSQDGINEYNWSQGSMKELSERKAQKKAWLAYLKQFKSVSDFNLDTFTVKSFNSNRSPADFSMERAELLVNFDMRGVNKKMARRHDRGQLKVTVQKNKSGFWKINSVEPLTGETLIASKSSFENITKSSGLASIKTYLREEAIRRGGYTLSTADYDRDGNVDMYIGSMGEGQLLKGNGKGEFKLVADKDSGLRGETLVKSAIFADFNNNGKQDLLLVRFVPTRPGLDMSKEDQKDIIWYENQGDKFVRKTNIANRAKSDDAMPGTVADFNNDGLLDFYVGFPGEKDFTVMSARMPANKGYQVQGLFFNKGEGKFHDVSEKNLVQNKINDRQWIYPHSSMAVDYDMDGDMDIVVIDDRANLSPVYTNNGKGYFNQNAEKIGLGNHGYGMGTAQGDIDNDGYLDFILTNVNFLSAERMNNSGWINWNKEFTRYGLQGFRLFKGGKSGRFSDVTRNTGIDWAGEGMAGAEFIDYNNDGLLDIYVANGLWSGTDRDQDLGSLFIRSISEPEEAADVTFADYFRVAAASDRHFDTTTNSLIMKILLGFKGDVNIPERRDVGNDRPGLAGHQRNRLYRNNGNGHFTEVGFLEGVDSIADGYIVATADVNNDGRMDMILRNADPGSADVKFDPVEVFLNTNSNKKKSVQISLKAKNSNSDAIGSIVKASVGDQVLTRHLIANNGTAQSQKILHFGLGGHKKINRMEVQWPSGNKEIFLNIRPGFHEIVEGTSPRQTAMAK